MKALALLAVLGTAGTLATDVPRMREPANLPPMARSVLHDRMRNHRVSMAGLTWSVILLDRFKTAELATELSSEPRLARADPSSDSLNGMLPPRFFELQDEVHVRAGDLARAAGAGDDAALAKAYGRLAETCVACHSVYLGDHP